MNCRQCGVELVPVRGCSAPQFENAMSITFGGGYGMFLDDIVFDPKELTVFICHSCCHSLCDVITWVNELVAPSDSHSHGDEFRAANPDHYGWDYDI
jgi:hypothetical protein